jgi:signal transduction histidine kinase
VAAFRHDPAALHVDVAVAGDGPVARLDRAMVQRVVLNLLLNAVQAMDGAGTATLSCTSTDGWTEIAVTDTGPGIPPDLRERIFEPFYTTKARGSGLGLAIARQVAESHGGTLVVTSGATGGARFVLRLPSA